MGHDVTCFTYGPYVGEYYPHDRTAERRQKNDALLQLARQLKSGAGLDLVFCYVYDDFLLTDHAKALAALDVPMVNFNVDMINQWYRQLRTAKYFTRILCAQRSNMQNLARGGARVMYFPMAASLPTSGSAAEANWRPGAPVGFVGTPMPYRTRVLSELYKAGIPLAIYGKYWRDRRQAEPIHMAGKTLNDIWHYAWPRLRAEGPAVLLRVLRQRLAPATRHEDVCELPESILHGFVPESAMAALFRDTPINLGITRLIGADPHVAGINQLKLRDFEVPMAGGFYLVENAPDYDQLFKPGIEVETWSNPGELQEKIHYYLEHPAKREAIARAGAERARAEHSWNARFAMLFKELGLTG